MKAGTGAVVHRPFVKLFPKNSGLLAASGVGPCQDLCHRLAFCIDTHETVPEAACGDVRYLALYLLGLFQHVVHRRGYLIKGLVRIYLGTAVVGSGQ